MDLMAAWYVAPLPVLLPLPFDVEVKCVALSRSQPRKVLDAQFEHIKAVEAFIQPRIDGPWYRDQLLAIRKRVAAYINAPWEDVVLVDNASNGINVLLRAWPFGPDDVLLDFSTAYGPFQAFYNSSYPLVAFTACTTYSHHEGVVFVQPPRGVEHEQVLRLFVHFELVEAVVEVHHAKPV